MELLRAENITKIYDGRTIIQNINIHLERGELISLLGLSGAGKTTLFQCISGLVKPEEGRVLLKGEDITGKPGNISYMLQKDLLLPHKKVIDNVSLPLVIKGMKRKEARAKANPFFEQYPAQLSGGMRQRAALLRTYLASTTGAALLDEPFSALDTITKGQIHEWYLDVMNKIDLSTLFITHDIDEAIKLSDRVYIMTGKPGVIEHELFIETPRKDRHNFNLTDEFLNYKRQIIQMLGKI